MGGMAYSWNLDTNKIYNLYQGHNDAINTIKVSSCGNYVLTGSVDGTSKLFDFKTGKCIMTYINP